MKILFTNFHGRDGGGHVTYILALAAALAQKHEVSVATPAASRLFRYAGGIAGVTVVDQTYTSRLHRMAPEVKTLRRLIVSQRYDVIHMNGSADHRHVTLACLGLRHRPRLVWTKHNDHSVNSFGNWLRARAGTDYVIAVSKYVERMLKESSYARVPIVTIHHGIDTARFSPATIAEKDAQRAALFGPDHRDLIVFGSSGGTDYDKGWLDLVAALSLLSKPQRSRFRVIVAGSPPNEDKQRRVDELDVAELVVFPGLLDDVRPVLAACDIGFVLSYREALSYACREVMAMGLPALVSDVGGLPENVDPSIDGWIVPARAPEAIFEILDSISKDPQSICRMGQAARETAEREFALEPFIERTTAVYRVRER